ncbi:MAG: phosphoribosylamine--glycine ligase [Lentimicrobiaceae bacterium]|nr:phosphoribosylamine--glycine ligase [Lentimicrobiaceae bacterium]
MKILLLGSGGREHALAWKMAQSPLCSQLYVAPGNPGTARCGENIPLSDSDILGIKQFAIAERIDMVVVGPEQPLVNGIADAFQNDPLCKDVVVIGPSKEGAKLEGSKDFAKQFMQRYNIPTADYQTFTEKNIEDAYAFLENLTPPYVLKADGLAAGKGVLICGNLTQAKSEVKDMLSGGKFGSAGNKVVIEQFLKGIELSVFVLTDGKSYLILPSAKDYKRIGVGDTGLNTGGMGSVSPVPFADKAFMDKVEQRIVIPTVQGLKAENIDYKGFIFIGLMNVNGNPYVIEYNVRLGDPETESVLPRIKNDLVDLFVAVGKQNIGQKKLEVIEDTVVTVMLVSGGYPQEYEKNKTISNLDDISGSLVFHAGTKLNEENVLQTSGGRVMAITSFGKDIASAIAISNKNAEKIQFEKKYYRNDIGKDLIDND